MISLSDKSNQAYPLPAPFLRLLFLSTSPGIGIYHKHHLASKSFSFLLYRNLNLCFYSTLSSTITNFSRQLESRQQRVPSSLSLRINPLLYAALMALSFTVPPGFLESTSIPIVGDLGGSFLLSNDRRNRTTENAIQRVHKMKARLEYRSRISKGFETKRNSFIAAYTCGRMYRKNTGGNSSVAKSPDIIMIFFVDLLSIPQQFLCSESKLQMSSRIQPRFMITP